GMTIMRFRGRRIIIPAQTEVQRETPCRLPVILEIQTILPQTLSIGWCEIADGAGRIAEKSARHRIASRSVIAGRKTQKGIVPPRPDALAEIKLRSEEHTSELQSRFDLVCRLLLEKKYL